MKRRMKKERRKEEIKKNMAPREPTLCHLLVRVSN